MTDLNDMSSLSFAADSPAEARTLPADKLVAWVRANAKPVLILRAIIACEIDLSGSSFTHEFMLHHCTFQGRFDLSDDRPR
jgi:hypothetical protein